ncbi:MAG: serine/threonine protein kinase [Gammaproteobacteria bacterium]|nr:serine/threonine protein kinase [Gammaproteobacteria bacterium]
MQNDSGGESFKTGGAFDALANATAQLEARLIGRELGDYRVTRLIAEGGMSRVFSAERIDGSFERDVAIKVSPVSGLDARMRERFAVEQGVLAALNHPNISQLYDAAVTEEGWPYIVMELIDGQRLTDYADSAGSSIEQRVSLMASVVDAIAYAHSRLIVHRDIKPSNVLVDSSGRVKVLDFGIAKLLEGDATQVTREQAMTPRYASPEQLLGKIASVGSDIYQLGLLLAEVLTGRSTSSDATLTEAIQRAAEGRSLGLDPEQRHGLPRELVLIVEQCLRHDPDERYRDANALREDLEAFLQGYPVAAAGQGRGYRFRKFVGRNLPATVITVAAALALLGSAAWYTMQIAQERDEAQRQTRLAQESLAFLAGMFEAADPDVAQDHELSAIDVLELGAEQIEEELADQPEIQANLYLALGRTFWRLEQKDKARHAASRAVELNERLYGDDLARQFAARVLLASVESQSGNVAFGIELLDELVARAEQQFGIADERTLRATGNLGSVYYLAGELDKAAAVYEDVYQRKADALGRGAETTLTTAQNLVQIYRMLGDAERAIEFGTVNVAIAEDALGSLHPVTIGLLNNLAAAYYLAEGPLNSVPYYEDALKRSEQVYGPDNPVVARKKAQIGASLAQGGELERGEAMQKEALATMAKASGLDDPQAQLARSNYATTLGMMGRYDEVLDMAADIIRVQTTASGARHPDTLYTRIVLAEALIKTDAPDAAEQTRALAEEIRTELGEDHWLYETIAPLLAQL